MRRKAGCEHKRQPRGPGRRLNRSGQVPTQIEVGHRRDVAREASALKMRHAPTGRLAMRTAIAQVMKVRGREIRAKVIKARAVLKPSDFTKVY